MLTNPKASSFMRFTTLGWYDAVLDFLFRLTAKSSEVLLALGVILSTANHFQHGALFDSNSTLFQVWTWTQAIGFEASAGVVLAMALDANRENDKTKRNVLFALVLGLAFVGTVMLVMAFVEAATGLQESRMPAWYGITMAIVRGIVSVAYVTIGRVKNRRFSGVPVLDAVEIPDVAKRLNEIYETLQHVGISTEQRIQEVETTTNQHIFGIRESLQRFIVLQQEQLCQMSESFQNIEIGFQEYLSESLSPIAATLQIHAETLSVLPAFTEQLGQIEAVARSQFATVTEEFTRVKVTLEQQSHVLPMLAERVSAERSLAASRSLQPKTSVRPLIQLPSKTGIKASADFDKAQFVYSCLEEDPEMTIAVIQQRATERGQSISVGSISGYRKSFFERRSGAESEVASGQ